MLCFWGKSQSVRLFGHVEEQGSFMDKFIAWKSSGHYSRMGQPLTQPKWFKPGARTTLSPFGQRKSCPLLLLILILWNLGYGPSWERKACAVLHSNVEKLKKKLKESWAKIESETICATCDQVISRLRRVIIEKGGYIE